MSAGAPWSVKGIDPKAREVAKTLARSSGLTLGAWLNQKILEDGLAAGAPTPLDGRSRSEGEHDLARIAHALDRITDRIEASETRTGLAINGVEHSIRQALARVEATEREQHAAVMRLEGALAESAAETRGIGERLGRLESEAGPRSAEALRVLEGRMARAEPDVVVETVLERLGERLAAAEARTSGALEDLRASLAGLDRRLWSVERGAGDEAEQRFEALAQVLTRRVEAVRAEVAERLRASGDGAVEARLAQMADHVAAAEARSTRAVEAIGRQVLAMAEAVSRKLNDVDQRGAAAIDQVGTEVARIAGAVELRLARGEQAQAQAFERLTAELTRATAGLAERSAQSGAPPVATPVAAQPPSPDATGDAATESALAEVYRILGPPPEPEPEAELPTAASTPFGPELFSRAEPEPGPDVATIEAPWRRLSAEPADDVAAAPFAPIDDADAELFEPAPEPGAGAQLSTREVIEQARAAARAQRGDEVPLETGAKPASKTGGGRLFQGFGFRPRRENTTLQTALLIAGGAAFFSVSAAGLTLLQTGEARNEEAAATPPLSPPPLSPTPRAAMALSSLSAPRAGAPITAPSFDRIHADVEAGVPGSVDALRTLAANGHADAQLYLGQLYEEGQAGLPRDAAQARRLTALAAEAGHPRAMHNLGVYLFHGEGGPADPTAAAVWFRKAADAGIVESQYNLGLLYQAGSGVPRDLAQARAWLGRAAARGDAEARKALAAVAPPPPAARSPIRQQADAAPRPAPVRTAYAQTTVPASPNVRQAQVILTRLGYYEGPADGLSNEAYKVALFRYQKDQRDHAPGPQLAER